MNREKLYPVVAFILAVAVVTFVPKAFEASLPSYSREVPDVNYFGLKYVGEESVVLLSLLFGQVSMVFLPAVIVGVIAYWAFKIREKSEK
jgi:hypothetical protein